MGSLSIKNVLSSIATLIYINIYCFLYRFFLNHDSLDMAFSVYYEVKVVFFEFVKRFNYLNSLICRLHIFFIQDSMYYVIQNQYELEEQCFSWIIAPLLITSWTALWQVDPVIYHVFWLFFSVQVLVFVVTY